MDPVTDTLKQAISNPAKIPLTIELILNLLQDFIITKCGWILKNVRNIMINYWLQVLEWTLVSSPWDMEVCPWSKPQIFSIL